MYQLLEALGENPDREGLVETPKRVAQMMEEMFEGIQYTNADIADMFGKTFDVDTNQMVIVKDITCFSHCEHHMALMYDMNISIGYIPRGRVIGLSKMPRIAEMCCKRLQLQEKIGETLPKSSPLPPAPTTSSSHITSSHSCVSRPRRKIRQQQNNHPCHKRRLRTRRHDQPIPNTQKRIRQLSCLIPEPRRC